jgi:hypothetical protein
MPQFVVFQKLNKCSRVGRYLVNAENVDEAKEKAKKAHRSFVHYEIVGVSLVQNANESKSNISK